MPKKAAWGVNEKVVEARERKQQAKAEARGKEAKAKEDAYWAAHENPRGKKDVKKEQEVRRSPPRSPGSQRQCWATCRAAGRLPGHISTPCSKEGTCCTFWPQQDASTFPPVLPHTLNLNERAKCQCTQERKREEAAARKAEARRLAAEEEAALAGVGKKKAAPQKVGSAKVSG